MKIADSTSVLANFNNTTFSSKNIQHRFFRNNGDFYVNTIGSDGEYQDFKVIYTFGFTPLQQYIVQFPDGKFQCLDIAWDSEKKIWFDLKPNLELRTDEWIHWSQGGMR